MSGIRLHPKLGVNCHMTFCRNCGGDGKELVMLGLYNQKATCRSCGMLCYGVHGTTRCPNCNHSELYGFEQLGESERLPSNELCDICQQEAAEHATIVAAGGIYWRCKENPNHRGVLRAGAELSKEVRSSMSKPAPEPVGIEFDGTMKLCPVCYPLTEGGDDA